MGVNVVYLTLLEFSILVTAAEALSLILNRYRYPSIVGELLTGIALSPYALGGLLNTVLKVDLFSINEYIIFLSEFSVILLLFASGLEHGLSSLRQGGLMGLMAAVAGAVVPYVIVFEYAVNAGFNPGAASLIALTTAPTSLAVVAGVVEREGLQRHPSTGVLIAAASVDDVVALIMLSLVLLSPGSSSGMVWGLVRIVALWV
ncbi:MAG: cation:proton antiporter, partial [Caldivirga sp.]